MPVSVRRVRVAADRTTSYFLRVEWEGRDLSSGFEVMLTDGQCAWLGGVSADAVRGEAVDLEMKPKKYVQYLHEVLLGEGGLHFMHTMLCQEGPGINFTLSPYEEPETNVTLTYERVQKGIWIKLGSVVLENSSCPLDDVRDLLGHFLDQTQTLEDRNHQLQVENNKLRQEQQHITAELKRYTGVKETMESDMYSRFVLVINEKKAKIRSLQERIAALEEDRHAGGETSSSGRRKTAVAKPDSGEEDAYAGSTDEEQEERQTAPTTSTAPDQAEDTQGDEALDDSLSDSIDVAPSRKRRFRHLKAHEVVAKRSTPETTRTERTDPPVKSTMTASKQPATQRVPATLPITPDAEDLFEDF